MSFASAPPVPAAFVQVSNFHWSGFPVSVDGVVAVTSMRAQPTSLFAKPLPDVRERSMVRLAWLIAGVPHTPLENDGFVWVAPFAVVTLGTEMLV